MGQKAHPYGLRVGYIKPWKSRWFAGKGFDLLLHEDLKIRKYLKEKLYFSGISNIEIERSGGRVRVRIYTARPGVIIGRRGQEIDKVKEGLAALTKNELFLEIKEVKNPHIEAQLVSENIAMQLEKRVSFRKVLKKSVQLAMGKGALGIKVLVKGRLGGSEIAREEKYRDGKVPLNTFRADVDYGFAEAFTTYGTIGCKTWIYKGDILVKKEEAEIRKARQQSDLEKDMQAGFVAKKQKKSKSEASAAEPEAPAASEVSAEAAPEPRLEEPPSA